MTISIFPIHALKDNYIWIIINSSNQTAIIVDPGEAQPVIDFLQSKAIKPIAILITHHHWDHTNGILELAKTYRHIPVYGPDEAIAGLTHKVKEDEQIFIDLFPFALRVLNIPGHTLGHVAYYGKDILFCGDTLFAAGCGRVFEGTTEQMYASLNKIKSLPDNTKMYCAHEYTLHNLRFAATVEPTNETIYSRIQEVSKLRDQDLPSLPSLLSEEKLTNPFLRCDSLEIIANAEKHAGRKLNSPIEVFGVIRKWKDGF